ncbi:hypothetical protein DPEC_G00349990 [Dallia pectoralis]|uniref:Uncharacterized protein n=1 Tax=Dallia pectoralis TaxID=75939 RepID=A0ACC2F1I1_DALPE|nr:hypothetical protein DPEC_G00349990 [Dallia pectoralis]
MQVTCYVHSSDVSGYKCFASPFKAIAWFPVGGLLCRHSPCHGSAHTGPYRSNPTALLHFRWVSHTTGLGTWTQPEPWQLHSPSNRSVTHGRGIRQLALEILAERGTPGERSSQGHREECWTSAVFSWNAGLATDE